MSKDDLTVRNLAKRYVEWVTRKRENPLPQVVQPAAAKAEAWLNQRPKDESHRQDEQLMVLKEQQEAAKRQIAEQEAMLHPRDGGEVDEPEARQPIQMQREFSNDQEKEAYLERIRQAQRNASK